jgi:hypothetical protein
MDASIFTQDGKIEAYLFERQIDAGGPGVNGVKQALARAPGVRFVAQFVGAFSLFARVEADDVGQLQSRIAVDYFQAGVHSDWSLNLTASHPRAPKRRSPNACALVCVQATIDPFELFDELNDWFADSDFAAAVVTARDFDLLIDLGAPTMEGVIGRVRALRKVPGIGRTSTALAHLADNAIRPDK